MPSEPKKTSSFSKLIDTRDKYFTKPHRAEKMKQFPALFKFKPEKCPVYIVASPTDRFCFYQVWKASKICSQTALFHCGITRYLLYQRPISVTNKNVLSALQKSNVICELSRLCKNRYVGRTSQRLQNRIKKHVSKSFRSSQKRILPVSQCKSSTQSASQFLASDLAIGLHLLRNLASAQHYDDNKYSIFVQDRSSTSSICSWYHFCPNF